MRNLPKTAVIGASGFVGGHLWATYRRAYPDCVGTSFSASSSSLVKFDIRSPNVSSLRLLETGHKAVVIASAKPNIAYCERNRDEAFAVNVTGMREVIRQLDALGLFVMFLSSDYVFDGATGRYADDAPTNPTTEYGRHKETIEREMSSLVRAYAVVRLSKIYGTTPGDRTLLDDFATQLRLGNQILAATDQYFSPTHIDDLVEAILAIQNAGWTGIINAAAPERWSRYEIASELAKELHSPTRPSPVRLHDFPGMEGRPLDTSLECRRLMQLNIAFRPLREAMRLFASPDYS